MVHVWDVDAAREVLTIPEPGGEVGQLVFSPDGTRLGGAGRSRRGEGVGRSAAAKFSA